MSEQTKVPYYLLIHTDSYTGNFDRELVAYAIGILDKEAGNYAKEYEKAFWNHVGASDIDSFDEYKNCALCPDSKAYEEFDLSVINEVIERFKKNNYDGKEFTKAVDILKERRKKEREKEKQENICRLYDTYLCYTYQEVDDWEQDTFYNIDSFYKNKEDNYDTIFIQLNGILPEHIEKIVMERIKGFFEQDVYNVIKNYQYICQFGEQCQYGKQIKLLDLELVDSDYNLIKKYI